MRTLEELSRISRIEDVLAFFGVADDADVLRDQGRLLLKVWAEEVARIDDLRPTPEEPERLRRYGAALRRAYEELAAPARRGARGWRVIQGGRTPGAVESGGGPGAAPPAPADDGWSSPPGRPRAR